MNTLWLVLAISLPSVLVAVVLAVLLVKRKAQDRLAVERLLAAVKNAEPDYRQGVLNRLLKAGVAEERAQTDASKLVKQRRQYWKQLLAALLSREPAALLQAEPALRQFSEAHLQDLPSLVLAIGAESPATVAIEPAVTDANAAAAPTNDSMRRENDRLKREVGLTLSALNNIFAEYASMFGDEQTRRDMNLEEILTAMQQLAAGQPADATTVDVAGGNRPLAAVSTPALDGLDDEPAGEQETDTASPTTEPLETETPAPDAPDQASAASR